MTLAEHVAMDRERFIDGMVSRGFRLVRDDSSGTVSDAELSDHRVQIVLSKGFPYLPPEVYARGNIRRSWHLEPSGKLCLYTSAERETRPWEDPSTFERRVDEWFEKNALGWPDDPPVLDLEAYLELPVDPRHMIFDQLERYDGEPVTLRSTPRVIRILSSGRPSKKSRHKGQSGFVTNIGQVDEPVCSVQALLDKSPDAGKIRHALEQHRLDVLIVRYRRSTLWGAVAVTFDGRNGPRRALVASGDSRSRQLRAGPDVQVLGAKHVYVIGVGALGSHIADGLARAGLGRLTLRDWDVYLPGNAPRHIIAMAGAEGLGKASALKAVLAARTYSTAVVEAIDESLTEPSAAAGLLASDALVVDATADGAVLGMLTDAALLTGGRFVTVCLQNQGRSMRIDVVPPLDGAEPLPPTDLRPDVIPDRFETGCGEPVSPTPPYAVAEAAGMAVRHIVSLLADKPVHPSGELREWA